MRILSWNVNGLRAVIKKNFAGFLEKEKPDILCLQEIKIDSEAIKKEAFDFPGYIEYYNPAERKGYSGTAILIREGNTFGFVEIKNGISKKEFDTEGRIQILEFNKFYLINTYFPNSNHELSRLGYKVRFDRSLLSHAKRMEKKKPVVITGDFNVAHQEIDLSRPKENIGHPGFTTEERREMDKYINSGLVDTFRHLYPRTQAFSWWSYRMQARKRNVGWRLDYFLISAKILRNLKNAFILNQIHGSDHCPVGIELKNK